jgi:hypothetical protein
VAIERQENGVQIFRYFDSLFSLSIANQARRALEKTELWDEKTTWQNVQMPKQSAGGMDCGLWTCATLLRYLLFRTSQPETSVLHDPATHITMTTAVDVDYFGREARKMVHKTIKASELPPTAEALVMQLNVSL